MVATGDFNSESFLHMSREERAHLCRRQAVRASRLRDRAQPRWRAYYESLSREWLALAEALERPEP